MKTEVVCGKLIKQFDAHALVDSATAHLRLGRAFVTQGFKLPNPWGLHVRVASYINHDEAEMVVEDALETMMTVARKYGIRSLAMPAIGTGASGSRPIGQCPSRPSYPSAIGPRHHAPVSTHLRVNFRNPGACTAALED